jgi:hypothetical protein
MRIEKYLVLGAAVAALASAGIAVGPPVMAPAYAACGPGAHVNGTTAESTRRLLERHGYSQVKIDQKGCDNVWHVFANKDGQYRRYAVEPDGKIYPEGD